ncbi:ligand-binding sensor domain-containing diguanylate cyclase [Dyella nitratireducens]|uniref:diguanylate cyclase n=1 Tax=Dyella nitratireducens TaxID=1849580 RepID=A0ABQ1FJR6_9GAMM|nr:ligand-binding sensor domain-containing diguanylate cyclase [Dyella nitratireducens]GGA16839.1 GGDEF domain-containing protein [Dyella nitratireducens]GLQ44870.1 GGDEF domain-containing protein [Dyella nitratireducens]
MFAWVFLLLLTPHAHGQAISLASFTQLRGLTTLEDNCLVQDHRGFVYVCTENGLFRFDGHVFQRIGAEEGLRGSFIAALHEDASGRLWVGTRTGLYVGDGLHFTSVMTQTRSMTVDPGVMLADLDGRLYVVSQHRLWVVEATGNAWRMYPRFDALALSKNPVLADITSVFSDGHTLWFGCDKSLCQLVGDQLHIWSEPEGIPADTWTSYLRARDGTLWARSPHYIRALSVGGKSFANHDLPGARIVTAYLDMVEDDRGRLLTRANDGLARWDGKTWRIFDTGNGLPNIGIDALLYDRNHVLWIGTYGRGVLQWRGYDRMQSWQTAQGLDSSPTWAIARAKDGTLWIGNELGGSVLASDNSRPAPWPLKPPPLAQETTGLHALPDGDMLVVYYSGELVRYHANQGTTEELAHSPAYVRDMEVDSHGQIWLCTERGLYVYDGHALQRAGSGVIPDTVFADAREDAQGRLWFSGDAGLFRLDHGQWTRVHVTGAPSDQDFTHMEILSDGDIYLAGNFDGLWHGHITNGSTLAVQHIANDLLDATRIYFIRQDRRGWLWIGGTDGVELFDGQHWRRITEDDGLIWDDIGENAYFEDNDGSIWIGTSNGITHFIHPASLITPDPLTAIIAQVSLGGAPQLPASSYRFDDALQQPLTLHLATLGAPTRRTLQYRYRLQGLEHNWVTSDRSQVDYPPLPPGDFVFEVAAYDPDSRQLSPVIQLPIHIVPPWWQRTPAILAGVILLMMGIALIWQIRTQNLRQRARTLERLVAQRTHELEVDKQTLEETRAALWHQANHDALTGLPNRSRILEILTQAMVHAREHHQPLAVALIDLDHFKHINDCYGHLAGDAVLIEASKRLRDTLSPDATLGRYGGEEILAVIPVTSPTSYSPFEALRQCIAQAPFGGDGARVELTCSVGVAWLQPQDRDGFDLIRRADVALYMAKTSGRDQVMVAGEGCQSA